MVFNALENLDPLNRRNRIADVLMNYAFHLYDVSFESPTVFTLAYGFKDCTAPELNVTEKSIKEGTFEYSRSVIERAEWQDVTFSRGAKFFDSDFYDWIQYSVRGGKVNSVSPFTGGIRRNLLLVQYSNIAVTSSATNSQALGSTSSFLPNLAFQTIKSIVTRVPARAWLMVDCIPRDYKSGTDYDAQAADTSIMSLTVRPWYCEEFNTGL